jgi:hypothetical protein
MEIIRYQGAISCQSQGKRKSLLTPPPPYYHCISRCVRRAFLCGEDAFTGKSFEHRRGWVHDKLFELADVFSIDLTGYLIMSNHLHVVLYIDQKSTIQWEPHEVVER